MPGYLVQMETQHISHAVCSVAKISKSVGTGAYQSLGKPYLDQADPGMEPGRRVREPWTNTWWSSFCFRDSAQKSIRNPTRQVNRWQAKARAVDVRFPGGLEPHML
ncbi:hypothetical protein GOODEAATRI_016380 [Goodea atripinnis]|uniref:Uncharacterized protein n=1 Tax=Goodea atripinnis TaxID=208336 RepID=A0ABV0MIN2_9TELE